MYVVSNFLLATDFLIVESFFIWQATNVVVLKNVYINNGINISDTVIFTSIYNTDNAWEILNIVLWNNAAFEINLFRSRCSIMVASGVFLQPIARVYTNKNKTTAMIDTVFLVKDNLLLNFCFNFSNLFTIKYFFNSITNKLLHNLTNFSSIWLNFYKIILIIYII